MKNLLLYTALFLFISLNSAQYSSRGVIQPIDQEDYDSIFHEAFTAKDKTVIRGSDLNRTLNSVIRAAFTKNKFFIDEEMIDAILLSLIQDYGSEFTRDDFPTLVADIPKHAANFREKVFSDLIEKYGVRKFFDDPAIVEEINNSPNTYGLTYAAHKVLFFDANKIIAQQAEGEKITETIRQREEIKVTATKSDGSSEVIKDDVVEAELRRTQPRTDL